MLNARFVGVKDHFGIRRTTQTVEIYYEIPFGPQQPDKTRCLYFLRPSKLCPSRAAIIGPIMSPISDHLRRFGSSESDRIYGIRYNVRDTSAQ